MLFWIDFFSAIYMMNYYSVFYVDASLLISVAYQIYSLINTATLYNIRYRKTHIYSLMSEPSSSKRRSPRALAHYNHYFIVIPNFLRLNTPRTTFQDFYSCFSRTKSWLNQRNGSGNDEYIMWSTYNRTSCAINSNVYNTNKKNWIWS